jgi:plastocyanin
LSRAIVLYMRKLLGALIALVLIAPAGAAGQGARHTVTIEGVQFNPAELLVHPGDRIVWVNKDLLPHTATAAGKLFDSGSIAANASWSYTVTQKGEIEYSCTFHPTMKGKIRVQ